MLKLIFLGILAFLAATITPLMLLGTVEAETPTVKLSAPSTVVSKGNPVLLSINLVNTTQHEFTFWVSPGGHTAELYYRVVGKDSTGKELARTTYGEWVKEEPVMMISRMQKVLKPDQSYSESMEVSKIFDLSRAGRYSFQVRREYLQNEKVDLESNTVTVEVK